MPTLTQIECTDGERARIAADMARVGARLLGAQRLRREGPDDPPSYYTLLIQHGLRAPCRRGECEASHRVWDEHKFYQWCRKCGTLREEG